MYILIVLRAINRILALYACTVVLLTWVFTKIWFRVFLLICFCFSGGCSYDMGVGFCLDNSVESVSFGCASLMEDYAVSKISPHVSVLIGTQLRRQLESK